MLRKVSNTQTATGTWAASSAGIAVDIERVGLITRIDATIELVPSATLGGANQPGGAFRAIQNLTIRGASKTYFDLPSEAGGFGGVLLHALNDRQGMGAGSTPTVITAPAQVFTPTNVVFHPGSRPMLRPDLDNPFDLSAFIPAGLEGQLNITWVTGANTALDDTVTLTSAVLRITNHRVMGSHDELVREMKRQGVLAAMIPAWSVTLFGNTATATDFGQEFDVPTGAYLRSIAIAEQDATATRPIMGGDQVIGIRVKLQDANENIVNVRQVGPLVCHMPPTNYAVADDGPDNEAHARYGAYVLDLRPYTTEENPLGQDYGLNLGPPMRTGQVKLGLFINTYAAGDDTGIIYDRLIPHVGPLA